MQKKQIDYLIVGAGIAGCIFAMTALQQGKQVIVIDNDEPNSASKAAAGIFNPITGTRIVKTWNADVLFPYLNQFYASLQQQLKVNFFFPSAIYRPFTSIESQNYGLARTATPTMQAYLKDSLQNEQLSEYLKNEYGGLEVTHGGYVMADIFLAAVKRHLQQRNALIVDTLLSNDVIISSDKVVWKNIEAHYLICCTGWHAAQHEWWNWLPFAPVKGELLHLKSLENLTTMLPIVVSNGMYFFKQPNGNWVAGATYDKQNLNTITTHQAQEELLTTLKEFIKFELEVVQQNAGIRPAVKDRKPIIGKHPQHPALVLFNGMGTKGISLAPYYAAQLLQHLQKSISLDKEVSIERFYGNFNN
jgi:glycine/D-amino acid oxidase-like deaminating enzyme